MRGVRRGSDRGGRVSLDIFALFVKKVQVILSPPAPAPVPEPFPCEFQEAREVLVVVLLLIWLWIVVEGVWLGFGLGVLAGKQGNGACRGGEGGQSTSLLSGTPSSLQ